MKIVDPHSFLTDHPREIEVGGGIWDIYSQWIFQMNKKVGTNLDPSNHDLFMAFATGYILANPILRQEFKRLDNGKEPENSYIKFI